MHAPSEIPRTGISSEALARLEANPPQPRPEITTENAPRVRAVTRLGLAPAMAAVRVEFPDLEERLVEIGGIECLEVQPTGPTSGDLPTVLYFFGGGHTLGSPEEDIVITAPLAALAGVRVVAPRYPLAPEHPYPAALEVAETVYRALLPSVAPARLVVAGESAGGNLALALFQRARAEGLSMPAALALLSPWADLDHCGDSHAANRDPSLVSTDGDLDDLARLYRGAHRSDDPLISPLHADFTGLPSTFMTTGTRDLLLSDAVRLDAAMRADGVDVTLRVWEGMWHVFELVRELPEAKASMAEIAGWVRSRVG